MGTSKQKLPTRDIKIPAFQIFIEPGPGLQVYLSEERTPTRKTGSPVGKDFLGILGHYFTTVAQNDGCCIGIGSVQDQLQRGRVAGGQIPTEPLIKTKKDLDPSMIHQFPDLVFPTYKFIGLKIPGFDKTVHHLSAVDTVVLIVNGRGYVLDIGCPRVAEDEHLKNRHYKNNGPRPGIAKNLDKFFNQDLFDSFPHA